MNSVVSTQVWSDLQKSLPRLLEAAAPVALAEFARQLALMRSNVCAQHPDVCQLCSAEIVSADEQVCDCGSRVCYSCVGKTTALACPHCNSSAQLLQLVAADKIPITFSAFVKFKPELHALSKGAQQRDEEQPMALNAEEQKEEGRSSSNEAAARRRHRDDDDEEEKEQPPTRRSRGLAQSTNARRERG